MSNKKLMKRLVTFSLSATMVFAVGSYVYANTNALPNGTIIYQEGVRYLTDSNGEKYSGWFIDSKENWYYFNESDKAMKTGWHHDDKDGYWYYLDLSNGKMVTGWQTIDNKEYYFQPVKDMGNYHFNNQQEKWFYSLNSKVPYGAMFVNTTTPDGFKVDNGGAKVSVKNGWILNSGKWYYYEAGVMKKDKWINLNEKWYYVIADGSMVSNSWKEIDGKSYYFGTDGAMYVNTTTPDGKRVDQQGVIVVEKVEQKEINYADMLEGVFIPAYGKEYDSYQWWEKNCDDMNNKVLNDKRIQGNAFDMADLAVTYYPELSGIYWTETWIENNVFEITSEEPFRGHSINGGDIAWKGKNTASLVYRDNQDSSALKVIDNNTIEINGEKYIKVR